MFPCYLRWKASIPVFRIRIRVAPKTYQNHEKKNVLKDTIYTKKKKSDYIVNIVYMKKHSKHLIGKTRFTELKLPRIRIRIKLKRIRDTGRYKDFSNCSAELPRKGLWVLLLETGEYCLVMNIFCLLRLKLDTDFN